MDELIAQLVNVVGLALGSAIVALIVQVCRKYGIDISASKQAQLESIAQQAILIVEEKATAAAKAQIGKMKPAEKFRAAVTTVLDKAPGITPEEAADLVNAQLPQVRAATVDFATAVLAKATTQDGQ